MLDMLFANLPWTILGLSFALCLAVSALGFRRTDWFISIGYGFSIAAQSVLLALLYRTGLSLWPAAQLLLLAAYGLRLALFLIARERAPSFGTERTASLARSAGMTLGVKLAIWIGVSALYVTMVSPALFVLASGVVPWTLPAGAVIMLLGLGLEAAADAQKSRLKAENPKRFVSTGLYGIVRSPNYFGEMLFWLGNFVAGLAAYQSLGNWLLAGAGVVCIELVMLGSARRLELKQAERYSGDPTYQAYVRRVPILIPGLPLYSLRRLRVYLG